MIKKRLYLTAAMVALIAASCSDDADEKLSWAQLRNT